jgi:type II secretory pathway component PulF
MVLMQITFWISVLNIILLIFILSFQAKNFNKFKSGFTLGLLLFSAVFLIQNIIAAYFYMTMMPLFAQGTEIVHFIIMITQTIAFAIYLWVINQ